MLRNHIWVVIIIFLVRRLSTRTCLPRFIYRLSWNEENSSLWCAALESNQVSRKAGDLQSPPLPHTVYRCVLFDNFPFNIIDNISIERKFSHIIINSSFNPIIGYFSILLPTAMVNPSYSIRPGEF